MTFHCLDRALYGMLAGAVLLAVLYLLRHRIAKALGREASAAGAKLEGK